MLAGKTATATGIKRASNNETRFGYGKVGVIGAIARKGNVVCQVMEEADFLTYQGFVRRAVSERVSLVATDENIAYKHLGLPHESVSHSRNEYVRGNVHTNNIESFWSLLKRGVVGTFHKVSAPYLPLCLAEFSFRFNNRKNPDIFGELPFALLVECNI